MKKIILNLTLLYVFFVCSPIGLAQSPITSNEAIILSVGPFFDSTDGITPEVAIDVTTLTVEGYLENDAGTVPIRLFNFVPTASGGVNDMALITSSVSGVYSLELTAAQLNSVGRLRLTIVDTDGASITSVPWFGNYILASAPAVDAVTAGVLAESMSDLSATPAFDASLLEAINWIYMLARNNMQTTNISASTGEIILYKDDAATKAAESDIVDDGTTFTRGEFGTPD